MSHTDEGIDPFSKIFSPSTKEEQAKYDNLKGSKEKVNFALSEFSKSLQEYFVQISDMSETEFDTLMRKRIDRIMSIFGEVAGGAIREMASLDKIPIDDIGMLTIASQMHISNDFEITINPKTATVLENNENLIRLLNLEIMNRYEKLMDEQLLEITFRPLFRITEILRRRFDTDFNWALASSLLSIHENLVKKKLRELDIDEKEIMQIERERKFSGLIDRLRQKIEENKENVGVLFYKSSTLRDVRNKMEHHGYKQKISSDDVIELLDDLEKFEMSIFKEKS
jgi:hypothetical protein